MKKVFGLFTSPESTAKAVDLLVNREIAPENISIISDEPDKIGTVQRRERKEPLAQVGAHQVRVVESNRPTASQLRDFGLASDRLPQVSNHVRRGGVVLVIDADQESAANIEALLRDTDNQL